MKKQFLPILCIILALLMLIIAVFSCGKKQREDNALLPGNIEHNMQKGSGITYKVYAKETLICTCPGSTLPVKYWAA
ncbi:hypothetical protein [Niabella aurantiaca]|uniref:hypothetical protein n=1 Tax=Niabella aurantiaca TaxID=379900 RepID=UPI00037195F4|nr:hypothetical protein [Niabella aurantiaca]